MQGPAPRRGGSVRGAVLEPKLCFCERRSKRGADWYLEVEAAPLSPPTYLPRQARDLACQGYLSKDPLETHDTTPGWYHMAQSSSRQAPVCVVALHDTTKPLNIVLKPRRAAVDPHAPDAPDALKQREHAVIRAEEGSLPHLERQLVDARKRPRQSLPVVGRVAVEPHAHVVPPYARRRRRLPDRRIPHAEPGERREHRLVREKGVLPVQHADRLGVRLTAGRQDGRVQQPRRVRAEEVARQGRVHEEVPVDFQSHLEREPVEKRARRLCCATRHAAVRCMPGSVVARLGGCSVLAHRRDTTRTLKSSSSCVVLRFGPSIPARPAYHSRSIV
ncbi:hypothetical protein VDGL01_00098 [Verticillium dahliae]